MSNNGDDHNDGFERGSVRGRAYSQRVHRSVGLGEAVARRVGAERSIQSAHRVRAAQTVDQVLALSKKDLEGAKPLERVSMLRILEPIALAASDDTDAVALERLSLIVRTALSDDLDVVQLKLQHEGKDELVAAIAAAKPESESESETP